MMVRFGIFLLWLLHFFPYRLQAWIGNILGALFYLFSARRRRVASINLRLCFPELNEAQRSKLVRQNFNAFARSIVERGILWWSS
ncbi:MAG: lipid A biosynthesis acyltransferase, partial [Proteobacteria bacterium]|nr:lipid A biosynthesis acyltransferase [Pseudomonadota bacterium]